jgi:parallel beta-helix repeat protein
MRITVVVFALVGAVMAWPLATPAAAQPPREPNDQPISVTINGVVLDGTELVTDSTTTTPRPRERKIASGRRIFVIEGTFGIYTIERCAGCTGPARLVIQDNVPVAAGGLVDGVNQLVLTDARIRARPGATAAQLAAGLTIAFGGGFETVPDGSYPHGVVMDGSFACRGTGRCIVPTDNRITVSAFGGEEANQLVKAGGGNTEPSLRFTVSSGRSFAKQAIEAITCGDGGECGPNGILKVVVRFGAAGDAVSLPGSIAVLFPTTRDDDGLALLLPAMNALLTSHATAGGECGGSTPCACGDTVTASRTLDRDPILDSVCPGDGLIIGQSGVVLTIKGGNTIRGSGEGTGILLGAGVSGVTVQSGTIAGFATGVRATGNDGGTFSALRVTGNTDAGLDVTGNGNTIDRVLAEANGAGLVVDGDGNVVTGNRAEGNGGGISVTGAGNTVSRNVVKLSAAAGMVIDGTGALVERNQITSSGDAGLTLTGTGHTVSRNAVKLSGGHGLAIPSGGAMTLGRNTTDRSGGFGIRDETAGGGTGGTANTYAKNVCEGAALGDSAPAGLCL